MRLRQPPSFDAFRCVGADCEDTCCDGWGITVDRQTYTKYQQCRDPELRPSFGQLITINETDPSDDHYAKITLSGTGCPFLADGLCSIQKRLGEEYLSKTCATYPRVTNIIDDVMQRSLDLSCPEAARMVLLSPGRMEFLEEEGVADISRFANVSTLDTGGKPYRRFWEVHGSVISLLQNRSNPLWKRLIEVGCLCDKLDGPTIGAPQESRAQPETQLEIVLELMIARIATDFTNRRFLDCYQEFMYGIEWTTKSTMEEIGLRYTEARDQYYAPFMVEHEYMLENYLVNYAEKTLFPFGPQKSSHRVSARHGERSIRAQCMLMAVYFAIIKTVLIGMAGFHKTTLSSDHVVKLIQSFTRAFEHSLSYPEQVSRILRSKDMNSAASMAVLLQN